MHVCMYMYICMYAYDGLKGRGDGLKGRECEGSGCTSGEKVRSRVTSAMSRHG